jgi:hypothetical protein
MKLEGKIDGKLQKDMKSFKIGGREKTSDSGLWNNRDRKKSGQRIRRQRLRSPVQRVGASEFDAMEFEQC